MIHASWHSLGRCGTEGWWGCEVYVCVCVSGGVFGENYPILLPSTESCISEGCWQIWVYPWGDWGDCSRSSVSVLMTSLLGWTQFCWLLLFFVVTVICLKGQFTPKSVVLPVVLFYPPRLFWCELPDCGDRATPDNRITVRREVCIYL